MASVLNREEKKDNNAAGATSTVRITNQPWYKMTEKILYNYPGIDSAIKSQEALLNDIDNNIMPSGTAKYKPGPPSTAERASEPEAYADRRTRVMGRVESRIAILKARKYAVEGALARLDEESRKLVKLWYFENWSKQKRPGNKAIWKELGIGQNTFYSRRAAAVEEVARWLGELVEIK